MLGDLPADTVRRARNITGAALAVDRASAALALWEERSGLAALRDAPMMDAGGDVLLSDDVRPEDFER